MIKRILPTIVIYHNNCPDGFTSAWVFWRKFKNNNIKFLPYNHGEEPPNVSKKNVYIVDFCFPRKKIMEMSNKANQLTILDHHKSAKEDLQDLDLGEKGDVVFDMSRCGAQIAWDHLFPNDPRPWIIDYVGDRDLWQFKLSFSKEVNSCLEYDGFFKSFEKIEETINDTTIKDKCIEKGKNILDFTNKLVKSFADQAILTKCIIDNTEYKVYLVNCPHHYRSEIGNYISTNFNCDFSASYLYNFEKKLWKISCRASDNSPLDLSIITSKVNNGGGHPKAAGFSIYEENGENLHTYFTKI